MTFSMPILFVGDLAVVKFLLVFIGLMIVYWVVKFFVTIFMGG